MKKKIKIRLFCFILISICILSIISCNTKNGASVENTTLLIFGENKLINVNLDNNTVKWVYDASADGNENKNYLVVSDSMVYAPFANGNIMAFNINNGHKRWGYNLIDYAKYANSLTEGVSFTMDEDDEKYLNSLMLATQPIVIDGKLILSTGSLSSLFSGKTFALNKENGMVEWTTPLPYPYNNFAPVAVGKYIYINSGNEILKVDINTGFNYDDNDLPLVSYKFEKRIDNQMYYEDNQLFFVDEAGKMYCIDLAKKNNESDSIFKWKSTLDENNSIAISPKKMIIDKKNIYISAYTYTTKKIPDLYFYKINNTSGNIEKQLQMPTETFINDFLELGSTILIDNTQSLMLIDKETLNVDSTFRTPENLKIRSNLIQFDDKTVIYLTTNGIVKLNLDSKEFDLIEFPFKFENSYHFQNINSILLLNKSK